MVVMKDFEKNIAIDYPLPEDEKARQAKLEEYNILDTLPEDEFDALVELAATITESPVSLMNLLDQDRQWTKAAYGTEPGKVEHRADSVCQYTILQNDALEVEDLRLDDRFKDKEYVVEGPQYRSYAGYPLRTPEGFNLGAICVLDYSPKSLNESQKKALKTISEEIISRLELRVKQQELKQMNIEKDQFLRVVNHDIKSPINGIISSANYLQQLWDGDMEELNKMLSMIEMSGRKLLSYTNELMENALSDQQTKLHPSEVKIGNTIKELVTIYTPLAEAKNLQIELKCNTLESFILDVEKFKLLTSNLISNALKFSNKKGSICIDAEILGGSPRLLHLSVADSGIGIPEEFLPSLFEKNKAHQRQGTFGEMSSGIGLPIVKKFVELHNGDIKVDTKKDKGTTFHVVLPEYEDTAF